MTAKTTLLLLHGFPFGPSMWDPQASRFQNDRRVIAPDLRLEGELGADGLPEPATMRRMAETALSALDRAGVEQCIPVGFSMGGYVALALHELAPDRIAGFVMACSRATADTDEAKAGRRSLAEQVMQQGAKAASDAMIEKLLAPASIRERPELVERVRALIHEATPRAIASAALGMGVRPDMTARLEHIRVPVFVIAGEDDAITTPEAARSMAALLPDASVAVVPGAGHLANLENAEQFNRELADWLTAKGL